MNRFVFLRACAAILSFALLSTSVMAQAPALSSGDTALAAGNFDDAASAYAATLASQPNDEGAELGLGTIELYRNHVEAARQHLQRALALDPTSTKARARLAALAERTGGPGDYRITFRGPLARVPLIAIDPLPTLKAKINGQPVTLLIDTGAPGIDLTEAAAKRLHLPMKVMGEGVFAGGQKAQIKGTHIDRFDLPGLTVHGISSSVVGSMRGIDGFVGTGFFYHFLTTIDYAGKALVLRPASESATFLATPQSASSTIVPMYLVGDHFIFARAHVNGSPDALFNIDTGGSGLGVQLTKATLAAAGITPDSAHPQPFRGGGGVVRVLPFTAAAVSVGSTTMHDLPGVYFPDGDQFGIFPFTVAGIISHEFFRHTAVTFDFVAMKLIVSPA